MNTDIFERLALGICCDVAENNRFRDLLLADFPRMTERSFRIRFNMISEKRRGVGERINFNSVLKVFVKEQFPDYRHEARAGGEFVQFIKVLRPGLTSLLLFEKVHHFGLGKSFAVHLGWACDLGGALVRRIHPLSHFYDRTAMEWAYSTSSDLESCLAEAGTLTQISQPHFEAALSTLWGGDDELAGLQLANGRAMSFHEAARAAFDSFGAAYPGFSNIVRASLEFGSASAAGGGSRPDWRTVLSGRLSAGLAWRLKFANLASKRSLDVRIPFSGQIDYRISNSVEMKRDNVRMLDDAPPTTSERLGLPPFVRGCEFSADAGKQSWLTFVDSPEIMQSVVALADRSSPGPTAAWDAIVQLDATPSLPAVQDENWFILISFRRPPAPPIVTATSVSARDGKLRTDDSSA